MGETGIRTNRALLLLWSGGMASLIGFHGVRIAYLLAVLEDTGSPSMTAWIGFALDAPGILLQIPAGVIVDRFRRIPLLMVCQLIGLAGTIVAIFAIGTRLSDRTVILATAAFIEGSAFVFVSLGESVAVRDLMRPEDRPSALALMKVQRPVALLAGRVFGSAVYGVARWLPFVANAGSYLYCLWTLSCLRSKSTKQQVDQTSTSQFGWGTVVEGMRAVWSYPALRASTAMLAFSNSVIQVVLLLILVESKSSGQPLWAAGLVLAAAGLGGALGAACAPWLIAKYSLWHVCRGTLWLWTCLLAVIASTTNLYALAAAWCGVGGAGTLSVAALTIYQVQVMPEHILGRALASISLICNSAAAAGTLIGGYLLSATGVVFTRWAAWAVMLAIAIVVGVVVNTRHVRPDRAVSSAA